MKKTFYLQMNSIYLFIIGLIAVFLGKYLAVSGPPHLANQSLIVYMAYDLLEQNYDILKWLALVFIPLAFILGSRRLIVTETDYIHQHFIKKEVFPKQAYQLVATGSFKGKTGYGDNESTEKWKQLNVIDQQQQTVKIIKTSMSQKSYQKIVTYLKVANLARQKPFIQSDQGYQTEFKPGGDQKIGFQWEGWLYTLIIGGVCYFIINSVPGLVPENFRWPLVIVAVLISLVKNLDWRKIDLLTLLTVQPGSLSINGVRYLDQELTLVELTSSQEDFLVHDYYLTLKHQGASQGRRQHYIFKLHSNQVNDFQEIETVIVAKYGPVEKYRALMSEL